jgi:AcrR family transcriptional regulator
MTWRHGEYQPKQKRADEKKELILDAALEMFGRVGYHRATAKEIAANAGVATGSFYRYFRDKKAVFMAVCARMEADLGATILDLGQRMRKEGHTEQEILTTLIEYSVTAHKLRIDFHREVLAMQILDPDVAAWVREREERLLKWLTRFLKQKKRHYRVDDLEAAAELIYYSIEEVAHRAVIFESAVGSDRLIRALGDMTIRYLFEEPNEHTTDVGGRGRRQ